MLKKVVFYGYGSIAKQHIKILKTIKPNLVFYVIKKNTIGYKNKKNIFFYKSLKEIKNINDIKIGFVCSPYNLHFKNVSELIKNKIHTFVEKPFLNKINFLNLLNKKINSKKLYLQSGYLLRLHPTLSKIKNIIKKKSLGKIINVEINFTSYLPLWRKSNYIKSVSSQKKYGGGVINELVHEIDILNVLFKKISFIDKKLFFNSDLKTDVEERAFIFLKSNNKNIFVKLSFNEKDLVRYMFINFTNGSLKWNLLNDSLEIKKIEKKKIKVNKKNYKNTFKIIKKKKILFFLKNIKKKKFGIHNLDLEKKTIQLLNEIKK